MNISDMLNPISIQCISPPLTPPLSPPLSIPSPSSPPLSPPSSPKSSIKHSMIGKSRSRFSDTEDTIICHGVAKGLTWGQISQQLPHRKRATCFNRYRTLQGIRKSRKRSIDLESPVDTWFSPPPRSSSVHHKQLPFLMLQSPYRKY